MADGIVWENGGMKKLPRSEPVIERRYRYLRTGANGECTKEFQKQVSCYLSKDKHLPRRMQVIQYLGKKKLYDLH